MAEGLRVPEVYLYVEINNKDVSVYITPYLLNFSYMDNDGLNKQESDDVEIELEDSQGFFRDNPPARGSSLKVKFGYTDRIRSAGVFYIDGFTYKSSRQGDAFTIKALAKDVKSSFREIKTTAFENTTLRKIAQDIASKHGYKLNFAGADVSFKRTTQQEKTDLKFLADLCKQYGYTCKIVNRQIVIRSLDESLGSQTVYVLTRNHILDFEFETSSLYEGSVDVVYLDAQKKDVVEDKKKTQVKASGDTKKINTRIESKSQAEAISKAQKTINEMKEVQARLTCVGIPDLHAGGIVEVQGFGAFDRQYYISTARHIIKRSGYTTELELLRKPGEKKK